MEKVEINKWGALLLSGRIRRIGVEIALALMMRVYLDVSMNDVLVVIVLTAAAFSLRYMMVCRLS